MSAPTFRRDSPEKREERAARQLMETALGFDCWHLSQGRATNQTPGWPDMLFSRDDGVAVYYEAKAAGGKQSIHQKAFQEMCARCGWDYVCGTADALTRWACEEGLCTITNGVIQVRRGHAPIDLRHRTAPVSPTQESQP